MPASLSSIMEPCGPVADPRAAERAREALSAAADWTQVIEPPWRALEPVFAASPYLLGLARADPARLSRILKARPSDRLEAVLAETAAAADLPPAAGAGALRRLKAELHLLTALADLGGVWSLDQVTSALSRFADAAVAAALRVAARELEERGRLRLSQADGERGRGRGLGRAMGGAFHALGARGRLERGLRLSPDRRSG